MWQACPTLRVGADGGAHRFLDFDKGDFTLIGDMDSARLDEIRANKMFTGEIFVREDQNSTDLEKSIRHVLDERKRRGTDDCLDGIIVSGQFSGVEGRLDHTFALCK